MYPPSTLQPSRWRNRWNLFVTGVGSRGAARACECINTGCTLHKLTVETRARGQRLISYLDKGEWPTEFPDLLLAGREPSCTFLDFDSSEDNRESLGLCGRWSSVKCSDAIRFPSGGAYCALLGVFYYIGIRLSSLPFELFVCTFGDINQLAPPRQRGLSNNHGFSRVRALWPR